MKRAIIAISVGMMILISGTANAKGCVKGALVGGVAGHVAGHHAIAGAVAGCMVGRAVAKKQMQDKKVAERLQNPPQPASIR